VIASTLLEVIIYFLLVAIFNSIFSARAARLASGLSLIRKHRKTEVAFYQISLVQVKKFSGLLKYPAPGAVVLTQMVIMVVMVAGGCRTRFCDLFEILRSVHTVVCTIFDYNLLIL
jgi:hypothetical protein